MSVYEYRRGTSSKFWSPKVTGSKLFVHFGRIGTTGQTRERKLASAAAAKAELAKVVAEKLAKGYRLVDNAKPAPAKPALSSTKRTAIVALAKELGGAKVAAEVAMSVDDTAAYVEKFGKRYETLEDAEYAEVPWLGLIESLDAHGRLAEVDWKEAGTEVRAWLEQIGGAPAKRALKPTHADDETLDERATHEALALFGRLLGAAKLALVSLDKESDSYPLMVVPAGRVAALHKLARGAGAYIVHHTGKDLEALEHERLRELAKHESKNPWTALVAENSFRRVAGAADSVLWNLNHGETIEHIREVAPFAPKHDRPLIAMTVAIYDAPASRLAKSTRDPKLLLAALRYLNPTTPEHRYERLAAAAILAERLNVKPDGGKLHAAVLDACNVWNPGKATDAQLARVPAPARTRLARLGDGMLERTRGEGGERWAAAFRMLTTCGDADSLPLIAKAGARAMEQREENEYDLSGPYVWIETAKHIRRRIRARS
jgi:predicted DNA-binding WGR domain protein